MPKTLLVYPKFPLSFWGFRFALDFLDRKACTAAWAGDGGGRVSSRNLYSACGGHEG